jgi:hypothetical protein
MITEINPGIILVSSPPFIEPTGGTMEIVANALAMFSTQASANGLAP